ncbi:MAG TPA: SPOR domain-containing protein [Myxococcota bacterium]|nr:SPOR domain-containing protein [Myxococcota bacterium]
MMSDLERRRDARDVWVSRSHLHAAVVAAALLSLTCFGLGFLAGRHQAVTSAEQREGSLADAVPGRDLLAVLAEVERTSLSSATSAMQYPDLLRKGASPQVPAEPARPPGVAADVPSPVTAPFDADPVPGGAFTVEVGVFSDVAGARAARDHLRQRELAAWWWLERVDGVAAYHVAVGGFATQGEADAEVVRVAAVAQTGPTPGAAPRVVGLTQ